MGKEHLRRHSRHQCNSSLIKGDSRYLHRQEMEGFLRNELFLILKPCILKIF